MHPQKHHPQTFPGGGSASLTYYIFEGTLAGVVNGITYAIPALSGGGGGSTKNPVSSSVNNPYMYGLKTSGTGALHQHGGPIPLGRYIIAKPSHHAHLGLSARLDPQQATPNNRGGFFIHGRGPHGSDGCIVPTDPARFHQLMHGLTASNGGVLIVAETMDGTRFA